MTLEERVLRLERMYNMLNQAYIQSQSNQVPITEQVDDSANKIVDLTPYTETKIGYFGESDKVFYNVPDGNLSVFFSNYNGDYEYTKIGDRLVIRFDTLIEKTNITISIT